jgi:uncharacterized protein YkwD
MQGSSLTRRSVMLTAAAAALAGCGGTAVDAPAGVQVYRISARDAEQIPIRVRDAVNSLRSAAGVPPLRLSPQLSQAAERHARDMASQNRAWWYGSDLSTPISRVADAGYTGQFVGEIYAETYETELDTLAAWMDRADTRPYILDSRARDLGFGWHQERSGKLWWTLNTGAPAGAAPLAGAPAVTVVGG